MRPLQYGNRTVARGHERPQAFLYAALKSTGGTNAPVAGMLCSESASVQPIPESAGGVPLNRLTSVSTADQPTQSEAMTLTAETPFLARIRSSSGAKPSPPMTYRLLALDEAETAAAMPSSAAAV